jgi:hypothetical protein
MNMSRCTNTSMQLDSARGGRLCDRLFAVYNSMTVACALLVVPLLLYAKILLSSRLKHLLLDLLQLIVMFSAAAVVGCYSL